MAKTITVPDFDFTGFYYPELLEAAIKWLRVNAPEISNESPSEPAIQLLRAWALIGHLNNTMLDMTAHEALFPTAQLRDSLVAHLKLIGFKVEADIPSTVNLLLTLSKTFTATEQALSAGAMFSTRRTGEREEVIFENLAPVTVSRTDQLAHAFIYDASNTSYTDITASLNDSTINTRLFPQVPDRLDAFYVGHPDTLTDRLKMYGNTVPSGATLAYRWEFSSPGFEDNLADTVEVINNTLKIQVDGLFDTDGSQNYAGYTVRVTCNLNAAFEDVIVTHDGDTNYAVTSTTLLQTTPSALAKDYTVGSVWFPLDGVDDDTNDGNTSLRQNGNIDWIVPKTLTRDWGKITVNGVSAYWIRAVVTNAPPGNDAPVFTHARWDKRNVYIESLAKQGRTRAQDPIASSDGTQDQSYTLSNNPVIESSIVASVAGVEWSHVDNFLNSTSLDNHFTSFIDSEGKATITFGDGTNGRVPPQGVNNISVTYRTEADVNGNVGANTVIINRTGTSNVRRVTNYRPATGWVRRRGDTDADKLKLKVEGPASLRTLSRAVTLPDVEYLTTSFITSLGTKPFVRAKAVEEAFGVKTVGLYVVGAGGAITTNVDRSELMTYMNGDVSQGEDGVLVLNHTARALDYTSVPINIAATVHGGDEEKVRTILVNAFSPVSVLSDGVTYRWDFGESVYVSTIISLILGCGTDTGGVRDVVVTSPAATVELSRNQLPTLGTLTLTMLA